MAEAIAGAVPEGDDYRLVYNLGATKCTNFADFNRINYQYLRNVVEALRMACRIPGRLLYMSSLSALGPGDERTYAPLTGKTIPAPDTRYGVSKIKAETFLETCPDIPWTIFRLAQVSTAPPRAGLSDDDPKHRPPLGFRRGTAPSRCLRSSM